MTAVMDQLWQITIHRPWVIILFENNDMLEELYCRNKDLPCLWGFCCQRSYLDISCYSSLFQQFLVMKQRHDLKEPTAPQSDATLHEKERATK